MDTYVLKTICINLKKNLFVKFSLFVHVFYWTMYISRRALFSEYLEQTTSITYVSQQNTGNYVHVCVHVLSLKTI